MKKRKQFSLKEGFKHPGELMIPKSPKGQRSVQHFKNSRQQPGEALFSKFMPSQKQAGKKESFGIPFLSVSEPWSKGLFKIHMPPTGEIIRWFEPVFQGTPEHFSAGQRHKDADVIDIRLGIL